MDGFYLDSYAELERLRKRDKVLTWLLAGLIILGMIIGTRLYMVEKQAAALRAENQYPVQIVSSTGSTFGGMKCCTGKAAGQQANLMAIKKASIDFYRRKYRDVSTVQAQVRDYGCHVQCDIIKDGKVIRSFSYRDGKFEEL